MYRAQVGKPVRVCPYFSCYAALSLLESPSLYAGHVKAYIAWHIKRLNHAQDDLRGIDGTIYDYMAKLSPDGTMREHVMRDTAGRPFYDSTDSYAALFLMLLRVYYVKTADATYLMEIGQQVQRVYAAMCATFEGDLTLARPDFPVRYTMDNCEVAMGLSAARVLFGALHALGGGYTYRALAEQCAQRRERLVAAMHAQLWDARERIFSVGLDKKGNRMPGRVSLSKYYPDAMAQLFGVVCSLVPGGEAEGRALYTRVCEAQKDGTQWHLALDSAAQPTVQGIWPLAAAHCHDTERLLGYLASYDEQVVKAGHPGCMNAECAHVAKAISTLLTHGDM